MKLKLLSAILLLLNAAPIFAQSTTVTLSVTDTPDNQTWNNGTYQTFFVGAQTASWPGGAIAITGGVAGLSTTGTASFSLPDNNTILPSGTQWRIQVCTATLPGRCFSQTLTITGASQTVALTPPSPRFTVPTTPQGGLVPITAYANSEITGGWVGFQYSNNGGTSATVQICQTVTNNTCSSWTAGNIGPANSPLPQSSSGPGPVFNVVNYGMKNDAQSSGRNCTTNGTTTVTCVGTAFNAATDVGKNIFCSRAATQTEWNTLTTIVTVNSPTSIVVSQPTNFSNGTDSCVWGTLTDTNGATAIAAAIAQSKAILRTGLKGIMTATPTVYFPAGGYLFCSTLNGGVVSLQGSVDGFTILGDGPDSTFWYAGSGTTACPIVNNTTQGSFVNTGGSVNNVLIKGITFDGVDNYNNNNSSDALGLSGGVNLQDVIVQRWAANFGPAFYFAGAHIANNIIAVNNQGVGIRCDVCGLDLNGGGSSNNGNSANLLINGVIGSPTGAGVRIRGTTLIDECGSNSTGCTQLINSRDVWFEGLSAFGTPNGFCVNVDANSFLHWIGGICGVFNNDTNTNGPRIANGGKLIASDLRMISSGTGKCVTANGNFDDNGGNTCESMFQIASGTSAGTSATITTTNLGAAPTANCSVGDSVEVDGAGLAGYNGYFPFAITAVGANSITYTTVASNIGSISAAGVIYCKNLQQYTGNLPRALLNNPIPNTCYVTGTFAATVTGAPMCNFRTQSATNITRVLASSTTATACTVAPVVTISDGTNSITLTITTAKSQWDSSVDASTGVGTTIFKPNGTVQVTNTAGTCTTSPTNFAVSYNIAPILSN